MTSSIHITIVFPRILRILLRRHHILSPITFNKTAYVHIHISPIRTPRMGRKLTYNGNSRFTVVNFPSCQHEMGQRIAHSITRHMDFRRMPPNTKPYALKILPPFAPKPCWWTTQVVLSKKHCSKSASLLRAWWILSQTPA